MSAETDLLEDVRTLWPTLGIAADIPIARLYTDDVKTGLDKPYCSVTSKKLREEHQAPVEPGDPYLHVSELTFKIAAVGKTAAGALLSALKPGFDYTTFTVRNAEFRKCCALDDTSSIEQSTEQEEGETVFIASEAFEVWRVRSVGT